MHAFPLHYNGLKLFTIACNQLLSIALHLFSVCLNEHILHIQHFCNILIHSKICSKQFYNEYTVFKIRITRQHRVKQINLEPLQLVDTIQYFSQISLEFSPTLTLLALRNTMHLYHIHTHVHNLFKVISALNSIGLSPLCTYSGDGQGHVKVLSSLQPESPRPWSSEGYIVSHFFPTFSTATNRL